MLSQKSHVRPFGASSGSQLRFAAVPRLPQLGRPGSSSSRQQQQQRLVCGAAAGAPDPYKVLGVDPDADTNQINRAYSQKKYAARGDDALTAQIEAAHSQLMMSALTRRMKGKGVPRSIAYADKEPLFPWRPKRWDATPKIMLIIGAMQMAIVAMGFQGPNMSKVVGSMLLGIVGNVLKQNAINPPPKDPSMASEEEQGRAGKNVVRAVLLGIGATCLGVLLFGAPEYLGSSIQLPSVLREPGMVVSLKIAGAAITNWIMTSFFY